MDLHFHTMDVFTGSTFAGNQLGLFRDGTHLPTAVMQQIAREMNLSETVFLGPPERPASVARARIFTPYREVPFAGHPTVGAALFLTSRGVRSPDSPAESLGPSWDGRITLVLDENVGPIPVQVRIENGTPVFAQFSTAILPEHRPSTHSPAELATMVGLMESDLCPANLIPEMVSCGLEYFVIPVRTLDAMKRSVLDLSRWKNLLAQEWAHHVYLVCLEAEGEGVDVRTRMYAPGSGVHEDPATGSAAAALGGYLAKADGRKEGTLSWTVEQGMEMGRPSLLYVEADLAGGKTTAVRVGGSAVPVSRGTMTVPL